MKFSKKVLSLFLAAVMVVSIMSALSFTAGATDTSGVEDNFSWELEDGYLTISPRGTGVIDDNPWWHYMDEVESVTIEEGITEIGESTFGNHKNLEDAVIPSSCKIIGDEAFHDCKSLSELVIREGVEVIGAEAFADCTALDGVELPASVKRIGNSAFFGCENLEQLYLNNGLQSIGDEAFCDCTSMSGVMVPETVTSIGDYAFGFTMTGYNVYQKTANFIVAGCGTDCAAKHYADNFGLDYFNLYHIEEGDDTLDFNEATGLLKIAFNNEKPAGISDNTFALYKNKIEAVELEGNIKSISNFTFANCPNLHSVKLNNSLETISKFAFANCPQLKKIAVPSSVQIIGMLALGFEWSKEAEEYVGVNGFGIASTCANAAVKDYINNAKTEHGVTIEWYKTHNLKVSVVKPTATTLGYTSHACACGSIDNRDNFVAPTGKPVGFKCAARTAAAETFTWNKVAGVSGYQIQLSNAAGSKWEVSKAVTANSYTFKGLTAGSTYKARVRFYIKAADGKNYFSQWAVITSPTLPAGTTVKATAAKKAFTAQWTKKAVTGYQLQYATNAKFTGAKTITIKNAKTYKYVVKNLKANTHYFVRIRTYKTIAKANYFSTWSTAVKVKTK